MKTNYKFLITSNMCDSNDVLKPESILDIFQSGAKRNAEFLGLGHKYLLSIGKAYVVLRIKYQLLKELKNNDYVELETWPNKKERIEFKRQFNIKDEFGNICVKGSSVWVVIDINKRMIERSDNYNFNQEVINDEIYFNDLKKIILPELEQKEVLNYVVNYDDIDNVGHLNNTKYLKLLYLVTQEKINELQIDFIKECKLNDEIILKQIIDNEYKYLIGYISDKIHFIIKYK